MSTETNTKRTMTDSDITSFITEVSNKRLKAIQKTFTTDDIASIGFNASQFVECISKIIEYPTKYQVEQFKEVTTDKRLLYLLENPEILLGLELKSKYDSGKLDCFNKILNFKNNLSIEIDDDLIMLNFLKNSVFFLPSIPPIQDVQLNSIVKDHSAGTLNLSCLGKSYYENVVNNTLVNRFCDREIEEMSIYATNHTVLNHWARLYKLTNGKSSTPPYKAFLAYIGALISQIPLQKYENEIKNWISILLEPILMQFDNPINVKINAKDDLKSILKNQVEFRNIFKSSHPDPIFIVQIFTNGEILLGSSSSTSLPDAEARASTSALCNSSLLNKAQAFIEDLQQNEQRIMSVSPYIEEPSLYNSNGSAGGPGISNHTPQSGHNSYYGGLAPRLITPEAMHSTVSGPGMPNGPDNNYTDPSKSVVQTNYNHLKHDAAAQYPQELTNKTYQRQLQESTDQILEAPMVDDEESIDLSSKEKLNQLLIKKRIAPAEYKTAKLNNSDVQVTCFIEYFPIAKATSTNKKKAGQICAQYILNYPEYFLQRFSNR